MYLVDNNKVLKFGITKVAEGKTTKYLPVEIKSDADIKEGQIVFESKPYTSKEIVIYNGLSEVDQFDFIKGRIKCNMSMDNIIPNVIISLNYYIMALSVLSEEDSKLFM